MDPNLTPNTVTDEHDKILQKINESLAALSPQQLSSLFYRFFNFLKILSENLDDEPKAEVLALIEHANQCVDDNDILEGLHIIDAIAFIFDGGNPHTHDEFLEQLVVESFQNNSENELADFINKLDRMNAEKFDNEHEEQ